METLIGAMTQHNEPWCSCWKKVWICLMSCLNIILTIYPYHLITVSRCAWSYHFI